MHRSSENYRTLAILILKIGLAALLLITGSAWAQSFRGSIRGTVTDPSGSVIAGATVTAKNISTGLRREATTSADGAYVLAELPAGEYTVMAESAGLSPSAQNVQVNVGLDTSANFDLTKVRKVMEQMAVTAEAPLVEGNRDVLGEVVARKLVVDLPLNGRDFGKLVALVPGATVEPSGVAAIQSGFGQFAINGNRDRSNNYTLDGTDNNDPFFNNSALNQTGIGGAPASLLPIDAIEEFNLQSQFPAEYGRNSGSAVNIITKSGTNQLHGSAFEFLRNDAMDARNYFNRQPAVKTAFRNNQFGASFGGPLIKDKTFFFGAYEGQRERVGSDFTFLVPTNTNTVGGQAVPNQVALAQQIAAANPPNGVSFTPSQSVTNLLNLFPQPTGFNGETGTVPGSVADKNDVNSLIAKIDNQLTNTEQITGRYAFAQSSQVFPLGGLGGGAASRLPQFAQTSPTRVQVVSASLLSTLSATRINEVRFGYSRYRTSFSTQDANFDPNTLGFDFGTGQLSLPEIDFGGVYDNLGATAYSIPRGRTSQSFQILDNFTWVRGRHTVKFGGEYRRISVDSFNNNLARGQLEFGSSTFGPDSGTVCPLSGSEAAYCSDAAVTTLANLYLGSPYYSPANSGNTQRTTYNNGLSFFAQDDFRLAPTFTVNFGLRWEYFGPISEAHNLLSNLGKDGNLAMVGTDGVNGAYARDLNNFGPRLGFAWSVRPTTVVRGGYGVYYDYVPQDLLIANFTTSAGLTQNSIGPSPIYLFQFNSDAFNGSVPGPVFTLSDPPCSFPCDIFVTPRNFTTPYAQNWNFNIEQELSKALALQIGYVGSKGTKLVRLLDLNQADTLGNRNNYPQYGAVDSLSPVSASTYHALQTTLRSRNWHGLTGFAGYTWSKSLDDASDGIDFNFATVAFPQNSYNLHAEHGPSNFDTRHRFTAAFTYDVPTLSGPNWIARGWQLNTIVSAQSGRPVPIVSANDSSAQNGDVYPTPSNFHQRPNLVPGINPINSNWRSAPDATGYLNGAAFAQPDFAAPDNLIGSFGNLGRNAIYGPRYVNVDFSLGKSFRIYEKAALLFRAEFFNILNHPNFALPNFFVDPGSSQQGLITQTPDQAQTNPGPGGGGPRVVQLALKVMF